MRWPFQTHADFVLLQSDSSYAKTRYAQNVLQRMVCDGFFNSLVQVVLIKASSIVLPEHGSRLGGYCYKAKNPKYTLIVVAANVKDWKHTLFHELAHYEQFKQGREFTERGVTVRARTLEKLYG